MEITAEWREELEASDYLRENNKINISKKQYLTEWRSILEMIDRNIDECGYTDEDIEDMGMFREALAFLRSI